MDAIVLKRGEGKPFSRPTAHGSLTVKVANRTSTSFETERATGDAGGPELHSHPGFDETFYVVSGEWEFVAGDGTFVADAGTTVYLPRGIFHAFRSTGRLEGKLFGVAVPGGIEDFFEEAAQSTSTLRMRLPLAGDARQEKGSAR
jgi:mannose-6-phosphate isomerase-like protein (cupin superfamily)